MNKNNQVINGEYVVIGDETIPLGKSVDLAVPPNRRQSLKDQLQIVSAVSDRPAWREGGR